MNYVIIGTGAAGIMAAKEIRKLKKDAQITMISADEQVHSRCMLHKYLSHERTAEELSFVEEDFFEKNQIAEVYGHIEVIDTANQMVVQREENRSVMTNCSFPQGQTVLFLL